MALLSDLLRSRLAAIADPEKVPGMQAYMKSAMPYMGVSAVPLRQVCREIFAGRNYATAQEWRDDVLSLWRDGRSANMRARMLPRWRDMREPKPTY